MTKELRKKVLIQVIDKEFSMKYEIRTIDSLADFCWYKRCDGYAHLLSHRANTPSTYIKVMNIIMESFYLTIPKEDINVQLKLMKTDIAYPLISGEIEEILHEMLTGNEAVY